MAKTISIEFYHGVRVNYNHELIELDYICDIWDLFKWDIKNDPEAKKCADAITRELICFGYCDLSQAYNCLLTIELLPPQKNDPAEENEK